MTRDRASGIAVILGALAGLVTMALHPTGHDLVGAVGQSAWPARLNVIGHSIAIASSPLLLFGAIGLTRRVSSDHGLETLALVTYGFAHAAVMSAAIASGLLAPGLIAEIAGAEGMEKQLVDVVFHYNSRVNQAFAKVFVMLSSVAIGMWSVAMLTRRALPRWIGIFGVVTGALVILALLSGIVRLNVHGFGLIVIAQSAWLVAVGIHLYRHPTTAMTGGSTADR